MSTTSCQHRSEGPAVVRCAVVTVSDTRVPANDRGGNCLCDHLTSGGHVIAWRKIVPDEPSKLREVIEQASSDEQVDALLMTGGTGIGSRDQTYETVSGMLEKTLPGYGELFRMLSFQAIGAAAMLSRAQAGVCRGKIVITMPGSPQAVELAMQQLILPELGHLIREVRR